MAIVMSADWGPYANAHDAQLNLSRFVDRAFSPDVGVAWAANGSVYPLRAPRRDGDGYGDVAVFEWRPDASPVVPARPNTFWEETKAVALQALDRLGKAELAQSDAQLAFGKALAAPLMRVLSQNRDDAAGVALDVLCVAFSVGLLVTGIGTLGGIAIFGGSLLLLLDGTAYGLEMAGDQERAEGLKKRTEIIRLVATLATLPDLAWGGLKAIREYREVRDLAEVSKKTALAADALAARSASAERAKRYAEIAEKARLRSQIRAEQLRGLRLHEMIPRGSGTGSIFLLLKEEFTTDQSVLNRFLRGLQIHCVAVHA
ncbi:hypothetical protein [Lichenicola sp.]|uniref:hypothetical protein n=1 Tax=Lichenicola sp. TaxID=2804529 RepID=UPI003B00E82F